jgi:hypothetical protein
MRRHCSGVSIQRRIPKPEKANYAEKYWSMRFCYRHLRRGTASMGMASGNICDTDFTIKPANRHGWCAV